MTGAQAVDRLALLAAVRAERFPDWRDVQAEGRRPVVTAAPVLLIPAAVVLDCLEHTA